MTARLRASRSTAPPLDCPDAPGTPAQAATGTEPHRAIPGGNPCRILRGGEPCGGEIGPIAGGGLGCYRCLSFWPSERWRVPEAKRDPCQDEIGGWLP